MIDYDYIPVVHEATTGALEVYRYNWETKTQFAEVDCVWNSDIQHRVHMAMEDLSSHVEILGMALEQALARINVLEEKAKH